MAWRRTSLPDIDYNCIGHALRIKRNVWPCGYQNWWPRPYPAPETVAEFAAAFALYQYSACESIDLERGYEKIALYTKNGEPTHAARQLASGKWTSKISDNIDIEHDTLNAMIDFPPEMLCHLAYGGATHIFRRSLSWRQSVVARAASALEIGGNELKIIRDWVTTPKAQ
jgi:hypothetical protein